MYFDQESKKTNSKCFYMSNIFIYYDVLIITKIIFTVKVKKN